MVSSATHPEGATPLELWRFLDTEPTMIPYTDRHSRLGEWRLRFGAWRLRRDHRYGPDGMDAPTAFLFSFWHRTGLAPSLRGQKFVEGFRFTSFGIGRKGVRDISLWASMYARLAP